MQTSESLTNKGKNRQLPYNPSLRDRAKELRKAGNLSETKMWKVLHKKNFKGLDFTRQKIVGNFIVDFYASSPYKVEQVLLYEVKRAGSTP